MDPERRAEARTHTLRHMPDENTCHSCLEESAQEEAGGRSWHEEDQEGVAK